MMSKLQELVSLYQIKPYLSRMGFKSVAKRFNASVEDVRKAKQIYYDSKKSEQVKASKTPGFPKILIFDIETAPLKAFVWSRWKQNIYLDQTISEWFMISWSANWLYDTHMMTGLLTPEEIKAEDDSRISRDIWKLLDEADIIIGHNCKQFDTPKLNSRFIMNGLNPPSPYRQIDTLTTARKEFGFSSNKLDALAGFFGIEHKSSTSFKLWVECMEGNQDSLDYMLKYNSKDVTILEQVYLKLRPWIRNHPNLSVYLETNSATCPYCGSEHIYETADSYYTQVSRYSILRCDDCSGIARKRTTNLNVNKRKNLITSI